MKFSTALISLGALSAPALACLEYSHTLQESFVGTNFLSYNIKLDGENVCSGQVSSSGDFGQAKFEDDCNDRWSISLDDDFGDNHRGRVIVVGRFGPEFVRKYYFVDLNKEGFDHQFGCGDTVCVGIQEDRSGSAECV